MINLRKIKLTNKNSGVRGGSFPNSLPVSKTITNFQQKNMIKSCFSHLRPNFDLNLGPKNRFQQSQGTNTICLCRIFRFFKRDLHVTWKAGFENEAEMGFGKWSTFHVWGVGMGVWSTLVKMQRLIEIDRNIICRSACICVYIYIC